MNPSFSPYASAVSLLSRRYRTMAAVLLAVVLIMGLYGGLAVMPKVRRAVDRPDTPELTRLASADPGPQATHQEIVHAKRTLAARRVTVSLALAYWGVCSLFIVAVFLIAWLDFRETARNFVIMARTLRQETVGSLRSDAGRSEDEVEEAE